jgi:hypothetical protein
VTQTREERDVLVAREGALGGVALVLDAQVVRQRRVAVQRAAGVRQQSHTSCELDLKQTVSEPKI